MKPASRHPNVLFICSANKQRSKTAEDYFSSLYGSAHILSAGTNEKICNAEGTIAMDRDMLEWADIILVMEHKHKLAITKKTGSQYASKIHVLGIEDVYKYYQKELIAILETKCSSYFIH